MVRWIERHGTVPDDSRVLVAVSGGVDSMVLLNLLNGWAIERKWTLIVAHLNHQLRGRSSDADARFVQVQCQKMGVSCVVSSRDVKAFAKRKKLSIEMAAREVRHRFLAQTARRRKCPVIALAHHADDQAELVLLRLLRGSGSAGLGGMNAADPSPVDADIRIVRPLLDVQREAILAFARENRIRFREDRSNTSRDHLRNRVRHELLPLLREQYQPAVDRVLVRTAEILSAEADCINALAVAWLDDGHEAFDEIPLAVRRRVVLVQSMQLAVPLDFEACERLVLHAGCAVNAPGGAILRRGVDGRLSRVQRRALAHRGDVVRVTLSGDGRTRFAGQSIEWRVVRARASSKPQSRSNQERFDAAQVGASVRLRHWQAGDRFQPIGMSQPVKLQDLFTNLKLPLAERRKRIVAESASGEIFWVEGLRIGEGFKLGPNTRKQLIWRWNC